MKKVITILFCASLFSAEIHADSVTDWGEAYADFPRLCKELSEGMDDIGLCANIVGRFVKIDGCNLASPGHPEMLELTREVLRRYPYMSGAFMYLAQKGNENDIELLEKANEIVGFEGGLSISSEQIVDWLHGRQTENVYAGYVGIIPSFANTGPQALYVVAILWKAAMRDKAIEAEMFEYSWKEIREARQANGGWETEGLTEEERAQKKNGGGIDDDGDIIRCGWQPCLQCGLGEIRTFHACHHAEAATRYPILCRG